MHEVGIVDGVLRTASETARASGATKIVSVTLRIGDMREVVRESLDFAWEALREDDPLTAEAELIVASWTSSPWRSRPPRPGRRPIGSTGE